MAITSLEITNHRGETLLLDLRDSGDVSGVLLYNVEGLGPPKANVVDGEIVSDGNRYIKLSLVCVTSLDPLDPNPRFTVIKHFQIKKTVTVKVVSDYVIERTVLAVVESVDSNQFAKNDNFEITLACTTPYLFDYFSTQIQILDEGSGGTIVNYQGDYDAGVELAVAFNGSGIGSWMEFKNNTYGQTMHIDFTRLENMGIYVQGGDQMLIDTRKGQKRAIFSDFQPPFGPGIPYDIISGISLDKDWLHLGYDVGFAPNWVTWTVDRDPQNAVVFLTYRNYWNLAGG